jgi:hypothetical protein
MAFCNSCGSSITSGHRFCSKFGAPILSSTLPASPTSPVPPSPAVPAAPVPATGGGALKVILIVAGVVILLGVLGVVSAGFFAWRIAHHAHVHQDGDNVTVETPLGSVETTKDPGEAARSLGIDLYPGAEIQKNGSATASFGGIHTATLNSETGDSVDKVSTFYKAKFPNAMVTTSDANRCTIVSHDHQSVVTINIEGRGDKTKIQIAKVQKSGGNHSEN